VQVNEQLYAADEGIARLDAPLVMKLGTRHLAVRGESEVPAGTLEVPEDVLEDVDVRNPPSEREVLLAKADVAAQLLGISRGPRGPVGL
jgi:hypothetical protein